MDEKMQDMVVNPHLRDGRSILTDCCSDDPDCVLCHACETRIRRQLGEFADAVLHFNHEMKMAQIKCEYYRDTRIVMTFLALGALVLLVFAR